MTKEDLSNMNKKDFTRLSETHLGKEEVARMKLEYEAKKLALLSSEPNPLKQQLITLLAQDFGTIISLGIRSGLLRAKDGLLALKLAEIQWEDASAMGTELAKKMGVPTEEGPTQPVANLS